MESRELLEQFNAHRATLSAAMADLSVLRVAQGINETRRPLKDALRSAKLAQMWLGKGKGAIGVPTPYAGSDNPEAPVVAPSDVPAAPVDERVYDVENPMETLNALAHWRKRLGELSDAYKVGALYLEGDTRQKGLSPILPILHQHLAESRMWLGEVMNHLRK